MANTLLYKTDDDSSPSSGLRVELPEAATVDNVASALVETSISNTSEDGRSVQVSLKNNTLISYHTTMNEYLYVC